MNRPHNLASWAECVYDLNVILLSAKWGTIRCSSSEGCKKGHVLLAQWAEEFVLFPVTVKERYAAV